MKAVSCFDIRFLSVLVFAVVLAGCGTDQSDEAATETPAEEGAASAQSGEPGVVMVSADDYEFRAGSTFPSGWVKLRFTNEGEEPHFMLIWKLPEDRTFEEYASEVSEPFQELYTQYRAGDLEQAAFFEQLTATIPEWFYETVPMGGPGFTAPGRTSETTVHLEPGGNYVLECYVRSKIEDHRFHVTEGMLRPLVVSEEETGLEAPEADIDMSISNSGLSVSGDLTAGSHTAKVRVEDAPEGLVRHNVHLVRLEGDQTALEPAEWLDWVDAMLPPAPAEFLGGAGQTAPDTESYFTFDLEPGRYAFVSEGRPTDEFVHEFSVE